MAVSITWGGEGTTEPRRLRTKIVMATAKRGRKVARLRDVPLRRGVGQRHSSAPPLDWRSRSTRVNIRAHAAHASRSTIGFAFWRTA